MQGVVPLARPNRLDVTTRTLGVLAVALVVLAVAYVVFMRRFYYLHEEYLASLRK